MSVNLAIIKKITVSSHLPALLRTERRETGSKAEYHNES